MVYLPSPPTSPVSSFWEGKKKNKRTKRPPQIVLFWWAFQRCLLSPNPWVLWQSTSLSVFTDSIHNGFLKHLEFLPAPRVHPVFSLISGYSFLSRFSLSFSSSLLIWKLRLQFIFWYSVPYLLQCMSCFFLIYLDYCFGLLIFSPLTPLNWKLETPGKQK